MLQIFTIYWGKR